MYQHQPLFQIPKMEIPLSTDHRNHHCCIMFGVNCLKNFTLVCQLRWQASHKTWKFVLSELTWPTTDLRFKLLRLPVLCFIIHFLFYILVKCIIMSFPNILSIFWLSQYGITSLPCSWPLHDELSRGLLCIIIRDNESTTWRHIILMTRTLSCSHQNSVMYDT